ncbi:hypothetical protein [Burkholderia sp. WSM2232]|uniref:hypothetical protein n=1 Tax=Burkholderia sp. WSM2232 TaxID=944436 RepID=UPI0003F7B560|nr:hypothetical protein [Burkholderia sp. WSM2232]
MDSIADPQPDGMLDLTLTRNLEAFFRLLGMKRARIAAAIELNHGGHRTFVEVRNQRIMLTLAAPIDAWQRAPALRSIASRWRPERTAGVAVRGCLATGYLCVSCVLPAASKADFWLRLYRVMLELLESSLRNEE